MSGIVSEPARRALPLVDWPEPDRAAWTKATTEARSLFTQAGRARQWSDATRRTVSSSYGRWLGFLQHDGRLDHSASPLERVTPEYLEAYFMHLKACGNRRATIVKRFGHLAMAIQVMLPGTETGFITRPADVGLGRYLPDDQRDKRIFDSRHLLQVAEGLFHAGLALRSAARRRTAVRDAVFLAILAVCAPRARALCAMELDLHLKRTNGGYELCFRPEDMKVPKHHGNVLPDELTPMLDRYLLVERRELLRMAGHNRIWVSQTGKPLAQFGITAAVRRRTERLLEHEMGPNNFRHCLTTTAVLTSPRAALDVPVVLGHTPAVSLHHYNRATAVVAARRHADRVTNRARRLSSLAASAYGWRQEDEQDAERET